MNQMSPWLILAAWLLLINLIAYAAFGMDKGRAQRKRWRIAEKDLLLLAVLGGTPGAYLGRMRFRHKTQKREFSVLLHLIAVMQIATLSWFALQGNAGL